MSCLRHWGVSSRRDTYRVVDENEVTEVGLSGVGSETCPWSGVHYFTRTRGALFGRRHAAIFGWLRHSLRGLPLRRPTRTSPIWSLIDALAISIHEPGPLGCDQRSIGEGDPLLDLMFV